MKYNGMVATASWILVLGGILMAYESLTGTNLVQQIFGSLTSVINIVVFGGAALYKLYFMLNKKKK